MKMGTMIALGLAVLAAAVVAQDEDARSTASPEARATVQEETAGRAEEEARSAIERGKYLAHDVAMCVHCHTPRDARGNLLPGRAFTGAPVPVKSPFADQAWAFEAPNIAGAGGLSREDMISVLTTGKRQDGRTPMPPMPPYRMTGEDAEAVVDYLKSLSRMGR